MSPSYYINALEEMCLRKLACAWNVIFEAEREKEKE
jgi:hypothetical protein